MSNPETHTPIENRLTRHVRLYTPDTLSALDEEGKASFSRAMALVTSSIEELREMNGVETTDENLHDHEVIYPEQSPTSPIPRAWQDMLANFQDRTPFLIALEEDTETGRDVIAVCEGRVYDYVYNRAQVTAATEAPIQERAIFIEQTGIKPEHRGNKQDNIADSLYQQVYALAKQQGITLLIGGINRQNDRSRNVVIRQGRTHIAMPAPDAMGTPRDPIRSWPDPNGAYIPNPEWDDLDSTGKPIHVVLEYFTQRLGEMPEMVK